MPMHVTQTATDGLCLPSNKVVFICVLIKNLQLQLLAGGFVDDKLTEVKCFSDGKTTVSQTDSFYLEAQLK